jgi:hypothetical protein
LRFRRKLMDLGKPLRNLSIPVIPRKSIFQWNRWRYRRVTLSDDCWADKNWTQSDRWLAHINSNGRPLVQDLRGFESLTLEICTKMSPENLILEWWIIVPNLLSKPAADFPRQTP